MNKKNNDRKMNFKDYDSELILEAALHDMGLLFPETDDEIERFISDHPNQADIPGDIIYPVEIIKMAESGFKFSSNLYKLARKRHPVEDLKYQKAAGWFRAKDGTSDEDEKEISEIIEKIADNIDEKND